nr:hypothetical protein [Pedobacter antarcticus]
MLGKFVDNLYDGSSSKLVMQLLGNQKTSKEELQAIKDMLNQLDQ